MAECGLTRRLPFSLLGVRFNADKKCIGSYYTTKIWSFTMRAPCCATEVRLPERL